MASRSIKDCLNGSDPALARLSAHAARLLRLQRLLETRLPRPLDRSVRVANYRLGKLFLHADNSAVAVKVRQITPTLLKVFDNEVPELTGIEVRVQPGRPRPAPPRTQALQPPGANTRKRMSTLAERLPPDSPLRVALEKLVKQS
jgi:hypothetical protein